MKFFILSALVATLSGCVAPTDLMRDHQRIIQEDGGFFYNTHAEMIDRSYTDVKSDLKTIAPRCFDRPASDQVTGIGRTHDRFVRFYSGNDEDSFILAYLFKLKGAPDYDSGHALVAEVSSDSPTTTRIKTHHYHPPLASTYEPLSDVLLEWARDEHDMCLSHTN